MSYSTLRTMFHEPIMYHDVFRRKLAAISTIKIRFDYGNHLIFIRKGATPLHRILRHTSDASRQQFERYIYLLSPADSTKYHFQVSVLSAAEADIDRIKNYLSPLTLPNVFFNGLEARCRKLRG